MMNSRIMRVLQATINAIETRALRYRPVSERLM